MAWIFLSRPSIPGGGGGTPKWLRVYPAMSRGLWVQNFRKKVPLKGYFSPNFSFQSSFVKIVKIPPLWVQKSSEPYPLVGAFKACKTPSLWVQFFFKNRAFPGVETQSTEEQPPPPSGLALRFSVMYILEIKHTPVRYKKVFYQSETVV